MISRIKSIGLILLAFICLAGAAWLGAHPRQEAHVPATRTLGGDAPAGVRFVTVALGGFRGLLADILWVRASDLQDEGRFFEVAQLAEWITRLEPLYPEVWSYHAWNMAYNITAVIPDPDDRWHWVKNGISLLRDEGIPSNPHEARLYWELGWLFYDKVGGQWDEATLFYRVQWAREMTALLGITGTFDVAAITNRAETLGVFQKAGLDPVVMKTLDDRYGPLDWRLPESQAVYWGYRGLPYQDHDARWCQRLVWMGLDETVKAGLLVFSPEHRFYQQGPRLDVAVKGIKRCMEEDVFGDPLTGLVAAKFLRDSAVYLFAFGKTNEAEVAYKLLQEKAPMAQKPVALEQFVREDIAQIGALSPVSKLGRVEGFLKNAAVWKSVGLPGYAMGYETLARYCWDALAKETHDVPDWDVLKRNANQDNPGANR